MFKVEKIEARHRADMVYEVKLSNGKVIGTITKYRDSKHYFHPWKAFDHNTILGFFYDPEKAKRWGTATDIKTGKRGGSIPTYLGTKLTAAESIYRNYQGR